MRLVVLLLLFCPAMFPQPREIEAGMLLVADRKLGDPNFAATVVLIARYDDEGTLGLIINRRSADDERVFEGGPVENAGVLALLRSEKDGKAITVLKNVQLIMDQATIEKNLAQRTPSDRFRIYRGYAGWSQEQLENEIDLGAWHVLRGSAAIVFDPDPDSLWRRLIKDSETQIAALGAAPVRTSACVTPGWSPLLANINLDGLDQETGSARGLLCHYAGDCNIYVSSRAVGRKRNGGLGFILPSCST